MRINKILIILFLSTSLSVSADIFSDIKEAKSTYNQFQTYMFAYAITEHVFQNEEYKNKDILVSIGSPIDGELEQPDDEVVKILRKAFTNNKN